jgi:hypothetical protein
VAILIPKLSLDHRQQFDERGRASRQIIGGLLSFTSARPMRRVKRVGLDADPADQHAQIAGELADEINGALQGGLRPSNGSMRSLVNAVAKEDATLPAGPDPFADR